MASTSSSSSSSNTTQAAFSHLRSMFPNVDPVYLQTAIQSYPSTFTADKLIAKVASKMLDMNHGYWPTVLLKDMTRISPAAAPPGSPSSSSNWSLSRKGKGRADSLKLTSTLLQVDELASRNVALITLNDMFPEVDLAHLRQSLLEAEHSYLYTSLSSLLSDSTLSLDKHNLSQWHASVNERGKATQSTQSRKRQHEPLPKRQNPGEMSYADFIKDAAYAEGAFQMTCAQFPNIWKSSIKAIMAEHNNDYFTSVEAVKRVQDEKPVNFFAKTWAALTQALSSKPSPSSNPNIGDDFSISTYLSTLPNVGNLSPMLLYELQLHLSATKPPTSSSSVSTKRKSMTENDALNYQDMECGCCFSDINMDQAATCAEGCIFCKECLSRTVQESVFGQAPLRLYSDGVNTGSSTSGGGEGTGIRCLSIEGCQACFSDKELRRCLSVELYMSLENRLAQQNLQLYQASLKRAEGKKQVRTVQCPFCPYMEVEDVPNLAMLWTRSSSFLQILQSIASLLAIGSLYLLWSLGAVFLPDLLNTPRQRKNGTSQLTEKLVEEESVPIYFALQPIAGLEDIKRRMQKIFEVCLTKHGSTAFRCKNTSSSEIKTPSSTFASPAFLYSLLPPPPTFAVTIKSGTSITSTSTGTCGRPSCRLCHKLHYAGHECLDSTEGLRLAKEQAASNAIKRQCPECGLSFVKDNGCNKIVCRCGYSMCFVCRKGIGQERYAHFCQHVRNPGMACTECTRCDLFKEEDETLAVRKAVKRAEKQWLQEHPEFDQSSKGNAKAVDDTSRMAPIYYFGLGTVADLISLTVTHSVLEQLEQLTQLTMETLLSWK